MVTQGTVGSQQMHWLAKTLDEHAEKAAVIVTHHNPRLGGDPLHFPGGLIDSQEALGCPGKTAACQSVYPRTHPRSGLCETPWHPHHQHISDFLRRRSKRHQLPVGHPSDWMELVLC